MITSVPLTAVLPVTDIERATVFYRDRLGLVDAGTEPSGNHLLHAGSGSMIALMATERGAQSKHAVLSFEVTDLVAEISDLESRGVSFLDYDLTQLRTQMNRPLHSDRHPRRMDRRRHPQGRAYRTQRRRRHVVCDTNRTRRGH